MAPALPFGPLRRIPWWVIPSWILLALAVSMFPSRKGCACERTTGHCECRMSGKSR